MIILHAGIEGNADAGSPLKLHLWGEAPADVPASRSSRPAKQAPVAEPYPFDAGIARLVGGFLEALPGQAIPGGSGTPPVIWLPTVRGRPVPSSGLIADVPQVGDVYLAPWTITSLPLSLHQGIDLLCNCLGRERLAQGILLGPTLMFWTHVLRLAASLVARELIVPGIRQTNGQYRAVWQPVLTGQDGQRLARLVQGMPAACRSLARPDVPPPDRPPVELLTTFIAQVTDALVRLAVVGPINRVTKGGRVAVQLSTTLHDRWTFALSHSAEGVLNGDQEELDELAEQVRAWQRPIAVSTDTAFHLCFRVEEPAPEGPPNALWKVRYLLQARDDPGLYVPASDVWKPGKSDHHFRARSFAPREYLLTALGQAAGLSPQIEASLKTATPAGFQTDAAGAFRFLSETSFLLEQAGYTVLTPAWWTRKGTRNRLGMMAEVGAAPSKGGPLAMTDLVKFHWQAAVGDEPLTLQELRDLARQKAPLIKIHGQWVHIKADEIKTAIALIEKRSGSEASLREVVQMALGGGKGPGGLPFGGVKASGWVADLLSQLEGKASFEELSPPIGFQGTLRPYQIRGYSWLAFLKRWGLGACLADDMGLGKTIQTLALLQREWTLDPRPTLLICPTSVVSNWMKESERFTPDLPVLIHHGGGRLKSSGFVKQVEKYALVLSSYSLLHRDRALFESVNWASVILDEAQNIKNAQTKQAQAARALRGDCRIALTGTPIENHVGDLWSLVEFLNPGWLGTPAEFRKKFFVPIQAEQDTDTAEQLRRLTTPFILRRVKTDTNIIADLPEKLEMKVFCNLTREQATIYQSVVDDLNAALDAADGIQRKGIILATLTRLKQVCNHPAHFLGDGSEITGRSGKLARLTEMLEEVLEAGERTLIFTQFTEMGEILKKHLQETFGKEVLFLHGGVARETRTRMVERFQAQADGPRIFILSLKAGGTGLNLTAASHVFHFDRWWNPAVENQATDRAFRIGQTKKVQVHKFVGAGTVEEKIDEMIERKQQVAARVVGSKEDWLTELSNDQLKELFELRKDAVGD